MRAADVVDGTVVNVIEVESLPAPPEWKGWGLYQGDLVECPDDVGIGWTYDGTTFTPPPPATDPDQIVKDNITSAPDNLTGGPTLAEVFNVHN